MFFGVLMLLTVICLSVQYLTSQHHYLTSQHHYLTSQHHYLTSRHNDLTSHDYQKSFFSDDYVDLSDLYQHSDKDKDVDLSDNYVDLSDIMSTCQMILLLSVWH